MNETYDVVVISTLVEKASPSARDDGLEHRIGTLPRGMKLLTRGEIRAFDTFNTEALQAFECWGVHNCLDRALKQAHNKAADVRVIRVADTFPTQ